MSDRLKQVLDLLEIELQNAKDNPDKQLRLYTVIDKIKRIDAGIYYHEDDLTPKEKREIALSNLKKFILSTFDDDDDDTPCRNFRTKVDMEGRDYFYYDYADIPGVDYETYQEFVKSENCLCGRCTFSRDKWL